MAALELEGKIIQKLAKQNGQSSRGSWAKQDFVIEYQDGNYPANALITAFGDNNVAELDKYNVGDEVKVSFNLRAREYNGRWYNDVRMWRIAPAGAAAPAAQAPAKPAQAPAAAPAAPAPTLDDMPADSNDDLPF